VLYKSTYFTFFDTHSSSMQHILGLSFVKQAVSHEVVDSTLVSRDLMTDLRLFCADIVAVKSKDGMPLIS